jgi:hypothetical protein
MVYSTLALSKPSWVRLISKEDQLDWLLTISWKTMRAHTSPTRMLLTTGNSKMELLLRISEQPKKKYFEEPVYNKETRTFTGNITWGENTFGDAFKWKYKMIFASEFLTITGG